MTKNVKILQNHLPAVSCLPLPEDFLTAPEIPENSNTLVFNERSLLSFSADWNGKEDFSARVTFGFTECGLGFLFDITDSEVVNDKVIPWELWMQDSVELFLAAPPERKFGTAKKSFERLQLILTPPDEKGSIRTFTLFDSGYAPDLDCQFSGKLTAGGYEIRVLIPFSVFGDYDLKEEKLFRMQFSCNDYDRRDGSAVPPRKATLNQAKQPSASAADYPLFRLCNSDAENPATALDLIWNPALPRLIDGKTLDITLNFPSALEKGTLALCSNSGEILRTYELPNGAEIFTVGNVDELPTPDLHLVFTGYRNGEPCGTVIRRTVQISGLLAKLADIDWKTIPEERLAGYMALTSALEFLRMTATPGSMNSNRISDAAAECEARLALLEDRPLPTHLPEKYRYLELNRNFETQFNISYNRGGRPYEKIFTAISLPWGNIPCMNTELFHCDTVETAKQMLRNLTAYDTQLPPPEIAGTDETMLVHGHLLGDGLRTDLETERLLSLYTPARPGHVLRMPFAEAMDYPVKAVVIMSDTPESTAAAVQNFAKEKQLPVIAFEEREKYAMVLIAGTPIYPEISTFWHSQTGLAADYLLVRRGSDVLRTIGNAAGKKFMEIILAGKPITAEQAKEFAAMRAADLPVPAQEDFVKAQDLRTGDVHTHTIFSDGQTTPAGLLAQAPSAGFDFVVISDHDEVEGGFRLQENCRQNNCGLHVITGEEITMAPRYHINVYPITRRIDERFSWKSIQRQAQEMGAVTQLNHPMTYGTNFSEFWYNDFTLAGFDAVERRIEYYKKWQSGKGKLPSITGGTDTHTGDFGCRNCTVAYVPDFSDANFSKAVKAGNAAMIDPLIPELVYGKPEIARMTAAALLDAETPKRFTKRLRSALADFNAVNWIAASETLPAPYPRALERPPETYEQEFISYPHNNKQTKEE